MSVHYLHASDGVHLLVDHRGRRVRRTGDQRRGAIAYARELMAKLPDYPAWDDWSVYVYDEAGECEIVPFAEARETADEAVTPARDRAARTRGRPARPIRPIDRDTGRADRGRVVFRSLRSRPGDRGSPSRRDEARH